MLPFNYNIFSEKYPNLITNSTTLTNWSESDLRDVWYNENPAYARVLSLFDENTPMKTDGTINSWDASVNLPELKNNVPEINVKYLCTKTGTVDFGDGQIKFNMYDIVSYNSLIMQWLNIGKPIRYSWNYIILAHLITLKNRNSVGMIVNGTEGDVSGTIGYKDTNNSTWWNQTIYGAQIWQVIKSRGGFTAYINQPYNGIFYQGENDVYNL